MNPLDIFNSLNNCLHEVTITYGLYTSLFIAGLVGGFTHCSTMCGPFVLSISGHVEKFKHAMLLPYHFGRITTYIFLAVLLASVLNIAFLFLPIRSLIVAPVLMLAGVLFLISAFPKLTVFFPLGATYKAANIEWLDYAKACSAYKKRKFVDPIFIRCLAWIYAVWFDCCSVDGCIYSSFALASRFCDGQLWLWNSAGIMLCESWGESFSQKIPRSHEKGYASYDGMEQYMAFCHCRLCFGLNKE